MSRPKAKKPGRAKPSPKKRAAKKAKPANAPALVDPFRELGERRGRRGRTRGVLATSAFFDGSRRTSASRGAWGSTSGERSMESLETTSGSANADIAHDLPILREQSRALVRRAPLARGAIRLKVSNGVGTGILLQSRVNALRAGISREAAKAWQSTAEWLFNNWAISTKADAEGRVNFYGLERLARRSWLENGDTFVNLKSEPRPGWPFELAVQLIEADQVRSPMGHAEGMLWNGGPNRLTHGIEQAPGGRVVAYHLAEEHPGEVAVGIPTTKRISAVGDRSGAVQFLHLVDPDRVGQSRGVPDLAPVTERLHQLDDYTRSVVMAANIGACFSGFITSQGGVGLALNEEGDADAAVPNDYRLAPGALLDLMPGEGITFADPKQPQQTFGDFVLSILRQIGMCLGIPLEVLVMHFESSYSAARGALLQAEKTWSLDRKLLVDSFCQPVYEAFLAEQVAAGRLKAPGFFEDPMIRMAYCGARWTGPSPGQIDPLREAQAAELRMKLVLSTHQEECAAITGGDFDETLERLAEEFAMIREAGLDVESVADRIQTETIMPPQEESPDEMDERETREAEG